MLEFFKINFSDVNFNINLVTHSLILFTFLSIFFVFYISKIAKHVFDEEISHLIDESLTDKLKEFKKIELVQSVQTQIRPVSDKLEKNWDKPDKAAEFNNNGLFTTLFFVNLLSWVGLIIIIIILNMQKDSTLDIKNIIIENAVIFSVIGFVEFMFFTKIALKFIPVAPSFISQEFLNQVKNQVNKN